MQFQDTACVLQPSWNVTEDTVHTSYYNGLSWCLEEKLCEIYFLTNIFTFGEENTFYI